MPVHTRRSSVKPSTSPSSPTSLNEPLRRRITRSKHHLDAEASSVSPSPAPQTASTAGSSPESDVAVEEEIHIQPGEQEEMLHSREKGLRGRHLEDVNDFEEKGLLKREDEGVGLGDGVRDKLLSGMVRVERDDEEFSSGGLDNRRDREAFALLVVLYLLQGVPLGLTFGTLPFLLKPHLSYSQLAIFALSTWPYSLKLLWSPIVDAWFVSNWGRRKSWIVPVQAIVGVGMWLIGGKVDSWLAADEVDVKFITAVFGSLIFAAATQDIAVDGWALTLLSPQNLSYASPAQTIGIGIGSALSFTVFLAFNSADFSNKYFRSEPIDAGLISLGGYMRFWGVIFFIFTIWLAVGKKEDAVSEDDPDMDVKKVYKVMWSIVRLKNIQSFLVVHLVCKIGFMVNDSVTSLKLLEKGLSKEDLAVAVLLDFPAQMIAGWLAAKWSRPTSSTSSSSSSSSHHHPLSGGQSHSQSQSQVLRPWMYAFWARLAMAAIATLVVWGFPTGRPVGSGYFGLIIATTLLSSLASTVQFVGVTAFHTQIADPLIGGTYMTLLNTVSNLGGTWPKPLILRSVDTLTSAYCAIPATTKGGLITRGEECISEHGKHICERAGGSCVVERDGYYIMSAGCVVLGAALLIGFILPTVKRLQGLPMSAWRVKIPH